MSILFLTIGSMIFLFILRVPIAFSMMIASLITILFVNHPAFSNIAYLPRLSIYAVDMFALLAVPFFLLAGELVQFGLAERLIRWVQSLIGFIRGALGAVTILSSMFFGAISGSIMATIAAIGPIMIPEMVKSGYDKKKAAALVTASGFLGILIPPSVPSLIFATVAGTSVAELFVATVVPAFILASGYIVINYFLIGRHLPVSDIARIYTKKGFKEFTRNSKIALPILLMPLIVLGGIYTGIFTPTEAGVVAVVYGILLGITLRLWNKYELYNVLLRSARTTAVVLFLVAFAAPLGRLFSLLHIPEMIASSIMSITTDVYGIVLIISLVIFIMGMFMDTNAIIIVTIPVFIPIIQDIGFNTLQYASLTVVNLGIGCITPPFGFGLFMGERVSGIKVHQLIGPLLPYLGWSIITLLLVLFFPQISLWLPSLMA